MMEQLLAINTGKAIVPDFNFSTATLTSIPGPPGAPAAGTFHQATVTVDGQMYSFGSYSGSGKTTSFRFNPAGFVSTTLAALPTTMYGALVVYHNSKFYIFGGTRGDATTDFIVYDPQTNTYARETAPGLPVAMHTTVGYKDGKIYMPQCNGTTNYYIYDIPTKTLETISLTPLAIAAIFERASIVAGDYVYSVGGRSARTGTPTLSAVAYRMNITTKVIEPLPNLPVGCFLGNNLFTNGRQVYLPGPVVGGVATNRTLVYDIPSNTWSNITSPGAMRAFSANAYITNRMYFLGGLVGTTEQTTGVLYATL